MATMFERTIANDGGSFDAHTGTDIESGFAVGMVSGSFAIVPIDEQMFNDALERCAHAYPSADALGTWVHEGQIYIDPVRIYAPTPEGFNDALCAAVQFRQIAFYSIHDSVEFTTDQTEGN